MKHRSTLRLAACALLIALSACQPGQVESPATQQPTIEIIFPPTITVVRTSTPPATETPDPALTPSAQATVAVNSQNPVIFVNETIPDGANFAPGAKFTKTWVLQNGSAITWNTRYHLVVLFTNPADEMMGSPQSIALSKDVAPGENIEISIALTAPDEAGTYLVQYKLEDDSGEWVNNSEMWVNITVGASGTMTPGTGTPGTVTPGTTTPGSGAYIPSSSSDSASGISATLNSASVSNGEVNVDFCMALPDGRAWYPWQVTLEMGGQTYTPSGSQIHFAGATTANKCFTFSFAESSPTASGTAYRLNIGKVELPPEVYQAENCARAQNTLRAAYPGLNFTCGGPGFFYSGLILPAGMTTTEADTLILDVMSSAIYGPWVLEGVIY